MEYLNEILQICFTSKVTYCDKEPSLFPFQIVSYPPLIDLRIGFWPVVHFIRPCSLFPIDNLSIYAQNFFKFCIHIVIGDEWYGIVNGQNPTIFDGVTALSAFKKRFLACYSFTVYAIWMKLHRYVEHQRLHIFSKDRHPYLSSSWVIRPWMIDLKNGFWPVVHLLYGVSEWNFTDMLTIKGYILWERIVTLSFPDCELSTLDWSEIWFLTCSSFHPSMLTVSDR